MNELGDYLKKLIDERGLTIYQICKSAKLDRTTLQRTIKGERLPSLSFFEKLCAHINVLAIQRQEVIRLYNIKKLGRGVYENRQYIKNMLGQVATISTRQNKSVESKRSINLNLAQEQSINVIEGEYNIQTFLRDIIEDEFYNNDKPSIRLKIPFDSNSIFDLISHTCDNVERQFDIQHILKLSKNPAKLVDTNYNLKVITNILPFAFYKHGSYTPYYHYGQVEHSLDQEITMPYYILTSKYLVQLSMKLDKLIFCSDKSVYKLYSDSFDDQKMHCYQLVKHIKNPQELLAIHVESIQSVEKSVYTLEAQPCFGAFFTPELIEKKILQGLPEREQLVGGANILYGNLYNIQEKHGNYYTKEGLEYFSTHGRITDIPSSCAPPFTKEEIRDLLLLLRSDIESDIFNSRIVDSNKLVVSQNSALTLYDDNRILIVNVDENEAMSACVIDESSVCCAFFDFFNTIDEVGAVYTKKETLRIIDEVISQIKI